MSIRELGNGLGNALALPRIGSATRGEMSFTIPGTYQWVIPEGVTSISCVCIGGGGGGITNATFDVSSGGGGGLAWANNIVVKAGDTLDISVGAAGKGYAKWGTTTAGGSSYILLSGSYKCRATGGAAGVIGINAVGGILATGDGGGSGGVGRFANSTAADVATSGGGAAGYLGDGAAASGGVGNYNFPGTNAPTGSGGGGSGGVYGNFAGGSGGVGLFGHGTDGVGGTSSTSNGGGGSGGSGGVDGTAGALIYVGVSDGYGAGGSSAIGQGATKGVDGGHGAVRIIWGEGRAFPSTDCGQS